MSAPVRMLPCGTQASSSSIDLVHAPRLPCRNLRTASSTSSRRRRSVSASASAALPAAAAVLATLPTAAQTAAAAASSDAAGQLASFAASAADMAATLSPAAIDAAANSVSDASAPLPQLLWQLADAAAAAADSGAAAAAAPAIKTDWLTPIADALEQVLNYLQSGLQTLHVPYSFGWSIIALTALVKLATYPFTKAQVESGLNVQALKPQIDIIKRRYGEDKDRIQRETSALYEKAGVNPLAGCLPTLATLPVFWSLFRTLSTVSGSGRLVEGFYFIPSLAGPTSVADRAAGAGISWLYPFVNGEPPIGWDQASKYLVLPVLLVVCQYASTAIITPPKDPNEEENQTAQYIIKALPLMIGWFALNVPSGLGLYYLSNTVLTTGQQLYLRKMGGAANKEFDLGPVGVGQARHTGPVADPVEPFKVSFDPLPGTMPVAPVAAEAASNGSANGADAAASADSSDGNGASPEAAAAIPLAAAAAPVLNRRSKRKRRDALKDNGAEPEAATASSDAEAVTAA